MMYMIGRWILVMLIASMMLIMVFAHVKNIGMHDEKLHSLGKGYVSQTIIKRGYLQNVYAPSNRLFKIRNLLNENFVKSYTPEYVNHTRFKIVGDEEFKQIVDLENWSGNGTKDNPYIIENYSINANLKSYGILIKNTSVYFIIKNNYIYNEMVFGTYPQNFEGGGIILDNVTNAIISDNILSNDDNGISLVNSTNNDIVNNTIISYVDGGISLQKSPKNIIKNNTIKGRMSIGIYVYDSISNIFYSNNLSESSIFLDGNMDTFSEQTIYHNNTVDGKPLYYVLNISSPTTIYEDAGELIIANSSNISIEDLSFINISYAIEIGYSSNIMLKNITDVNKIYTGNVYVTSSKNITFEGSKIGGNDFGLEVYHTDGLNIINTSLCHIQLPNSYGGYTMVAQYSNNVSIHNSNIGDAYLQYVSFISFQNSSFEQVSISSGRNFTGINNSFSSIHFGYFGKYSNITLNRCYFNHTWNPVKITQSSYVIIENSTFEGNGTAISIQNSTYVMIKNNMIFGFEYGINIGDGPETTHDSIVNNFISWAKSYGVYIGDSTEGVSIYGNSFYFNHGSNNSYLSSHAQAYNAKYDVDNSWNTDKGGNFWSDWTGPDENNDGVVDNPYVLAPGGEWYLKDVKPLTNSSYPLIGKILDVKNKEILKEIFNFTIWGADYHGNITRIDWYINGTIVNTSYVHSKNLTISWKWNTTAYKDGIYYIVGMLHDDNGRLFKTCEYTLTVDNTPPRIAITKPNVTSLRSIEYVEVNATDGTGSGISQISLYIDDSLEYTSSSNKFEWAWDTTKFSNGNHQLKLIAKDFAGFTTTLTKNYLVNNTIMLHSPIRINNNNDFYEIARDENWSGDGTSAHPFYIDMYKINAMSKSSGIYIGNTTVYFDIRNCIIENTSNNEYGDSGIQLYNVENGVIENNTMSNNQNPGVGIDVSNSKKINVLNNIVQNYEGFGVQIYDSSNVLIGHNTIMNITSHFFINTDIIYTISSDIYIVNNTCMGNGVAIYSYWSTNSNIHKNKMLNEGILISGTNSNNTYTSHNITSDNTINGKPVYFYINKDMNGTSPPQNAGEVIAINVSNFDITNLDISNTTIAVELVYAKNTAIEHNKVNHTIIGIEYIKSQNTTMENNIFDNVEVGLYDESASKIANNTFENNSIAIDIMSSSNIIISNHMDACGILIDSWAGGRSLFINQSITSDNTVNGKPVMYYKNKNLQNQTLSHNAGEIILANVSNAFISNASFSNGTLGIEIGYSLKIHIQNVSIMTQKYYGIYIAISNQLIIKKSSISYNFNGIYIGGEGDRAPSKNMIIASNISYNTQRGIDIDWQNSGTIINNTITHNGGDAIYIFAGENNVIYQNIFEYNNGAGKTFSPKHVQAESNDGPNYWYNSETHRGNYWQDWAMNNNTNDRDPKDGIVDWPYKLNGLENESDKYPLKNRALTTAPLPPSNLSVISGNHYINLTWEKPKNNGGATIMEYRIYRNGSLLATVPGTQLWYNDTNVKNEITYMYYITAVNSIGESEATNTISATPSEAVPELNNYTILTVSLTAIFTYLSRRRLEKS